MKSIVRNLLRFPVPFLHVYPRAWLVAFVLLIAGDLASKVLITNKLNFHLAQHQAENHVVGLTSKALYDARDQIDILGEQGRFIKLRLVFNDRFVFGSGPAAPVFGFFLTLGAVVFLVFYRLHNPHLGNPYAWLLVFSGAFGNLIDKLFVKSLFDRSWVPALFPQPDHVSGVVDFVETIWLGWEAPGRICLAGICPFSFLSWDTWPTFNLADSFIVVGIVLLIITMKEKKHP